MVITEGAIDALSYHQLHPDDHTRYLSISGNMSDNQREMVQSMIQRLPDSAEIVLATDNDRGGDRLAAELSEIVRDQGFEITRDAPQQGKDWNEELKMKHERDLDNEKKIEEPYGLERFLALSEEVRKEVQKEHEREEHHVELERDDDELSLSL